MPERMHPACANKLLKLIEEPPANTSILMVTDSPNKVLGTIVSRSQLTKVPPILQEDLENILINKWGLQPDDAVHVAHLAGGNYIKALEQLTVDNDSGFFLEQFKVIMRNGWGRNIAAMKTFAEEMAAMNRERQKKFLTFCQKQIRENFIYNLNESELNYMNREEALFSIKFSPFVNERNVIELMDELSLAELHINQNVNSKMVFFDLSMRITVLIKK
jgi:DNA polymerase-3 subunit delta'